jgi:hypothetical protein
MNCSVRSRKPDIDLIDPACMHRHEVKVKAFSVLGIECLPDGLRTMGIQVIPDDMHLFIRIGARHNLHESDQIVLSPPLAALCYNLPGVPVVSNMSFFGMSSFAVNGQGAILVRITPQADDTYAFTNYYFRAGISGLSAPG